MKRPTPPAAEPMVDAPAADPAADQSAEPTGWEKRVRDAQAALTRKSMEFAEYRRTHPDDESKPDDGEDDDVDDVEPAPISRFRPRIPESDRAHVGTAYDSEGADLSRSVAEAVHGADVVADYDRAMQLLQNATTTADKVTAFQAFADLRARAASSAQRPGPAAERRPTRDELVTPRVETNRPDTIYIDETDPGRYAQGQNDGVRGYVKALLGRGGAR